MARKNHTAQLIEAAKANGWKVILDNYYSYWSYTFFRGDDHVSIRTGKVDQLVDVTIFSGGVIYRPRVGKFREVCVELSKKAV